MVCDTCSVRVAESVLASPIVAPVFALLAYAYLMIPFRYPRVFLNLNLAHHCRVGPWRNTYMQNVLLALLLLLHMNNRRTYNQVASAMLLDHLLDHMLEDRKTN